MVMKWLNENVGDPKQTLQAVREISQSLAQVDTAKLRLVHSIIESAAKVKGDNPQELENFMVIIKLIGAVDMGKLVVIRDITANLVKLVRLLPKEGLGELSPFLKEMVAEVKK